MKLTKHFNLNTEGRDFFVGDLHGCLQQFMDKLVQVDFDFDNDRVFCVGDLIDRGPDSPGCIDLLNTTWFHAVRGNHEDMMLGGQPWHIWMINGGTWVNELDNDEDIYKLKDLITEKTYQFLTVDTTCGKFGVVHAESAEDWKANSFNTRERNYWARTRIKTQNKFLNNIQNIDLVVVGHTPLKEIKSKLNVIYIDTGACFENGKLTLMQPKELINV